MVHEDLKSYRDTSSTLKEIIDNYSGAFINRELHLVLNFSKTGLDEIYKVLQDSGTICDSMRIVSDFGYN